MPLYLSAPKVMLEKIEKFPHISRIIESDWGSLRLKDYLDSLINDTSREGRHGFPPLVLSTLLDLSFANDEVLLSRGLELNEDPVTDFAIVKWKMPKNF